MAFTTWRKVRNSVCIWFFVPLCVLFLSLVTGMERPAHAKAIEMLFTDTLTVPPGSGFPGFVVSDDGPAVSFTSSESARPPDSPGSTSLFGRVDLRTGTLQAFASASGPYAAFATVGLNETLAFSWLDPTRLDPITVTGTFSLDANFFGSKLTSRAGLFSYRIAGVSGGLGLNCDVLAADPNGCLNPINFSETKTIQVTPFASIPLGMQLYLGAGTNGALGGPGSAATFDAGHTAGLSFILPEGATFVSNSGYFLTPAPIAVPEPTAFLLLGIGLIGMAALRNFTKWKRCGAAATL